MSIESRPRRHNERNAGMSREEKIDADKEKIKTSAYDTNKVPTCKLCATYEVSSFKASFFAAPEPEFLDPVTHYRQQLHISGLNAATNRT